jgi:hypothetical protein
LTGSEQRQVDPAVAKQWIEQGLATYGPEYDAIEKGYPELVDAFALKEARERADCVRANRTSGQSE